MLTRLYLLLLVLLPVSAFAQVAVDEAPLYYVTRHDGSLYSRPGDEQPYIHLKFREPLYLLGQEGRYSRVRTKDGARGYIPTTDISNLWIRVSKSKQTIYLYKGTELTKTYAADLGYNSFADKERRGSTRERDHWRTPEGTFTVINKNANSQFYKAFVLNYPNSEDAERGLKQGIITEGQYQAIVRAEAEGRMPPMNTALGGMIEIHGNGTGARSNWTQGCIAVRNSDMDELFAIIKVGTPVLVER